ncbi:MAG: response regulator [Syntrophomonadaceae bacterium]
MVDNNPLRDKSLPVQAVNIDEFDNISIATSLGFDLIRQLQQAVLVCDQMWRIRELSQGAQELLAKPGENIRGQHLMSFVPLAALGPMTANRKREPRLIEQVRLPGGRTCSLKVSLSNIFFEEDELLYLLSLNDVTDIVNAGQADRKANRAKSQFLAQISHEIRTPLLGILGYCERLTRGHSDENHRESVETIEYCARQLLLLVNNLLDISKIEEQKVELNENPFDLKTLVKQMILMIQPHMEGKQLKVELDWDDAAPPQVIGDEGKIRQVLINLLTNALKYTDQGFIKVSVSLDRTRFIDGDDKCALLFSVSDSGIGVAGDAVARIFEPFVQIDQVRNDHGNGLGLAICKQFVNIMGGEIWCEPNHPVGSVFSFVLLLKKASMGKNVFEQPGAYETSYPIWQRSVRPQVLLAEDIKINRKLIQYMLEDLGCEVISVDNGEKCVAMLNKFRPDVILMDMQMPVMNGFQATQMIRQNEIWSYIPIVALTAYAMTTDVERCLQVGCNYYLSKPFTRNELYNIMQQCLGSLVNCDEMC